MLEISHQMAEEHKERRVSTRARGYSKLRERGGMNPLSR
jgi:hypothetical protein